MTEPVRIAPSVEDLAIRFGSDKASHGYYQFYEQLFSRPHATVRRVLELGVGGFDRQNDPAHGGASLRMWKAYFPNAAIVGVDLLDESQVAEDRIEVYQGSQTDRELLQRINRDHGPFDVIIDDASHIPALTNESFEILFPQLAPDGIYVIEDLCTSYWPMWGGRFRRRTRATRASMVKERFDGLNWSEFKLPNFCPSDFDTSIVEIRSRHNIVAFFKGENTIPSDLNRPNPVSPTAWAHHDLLPVLARRLQHPSLLKSLDSLGLRGAASWLRRHHFPDPGHSIQVPHPPQHHLPGVGGLDITRCVALCPGRPVASPGRGDLELQVNDRRWLKEYRASSTPVCNR